MKWVVNILMALIIFIVTIGVFWMSLPGASATSRENITIETERECSNANDCADSEDGGKCMILSNENYVPFCGCELDADCFGRRSGICGEERCV